MAEIDFVELKKVLKEHPSYKKWLPDGVPIGQRFYISFGRKQESTLIDSIEYTLPSGGSLIVDLGSDGKVYSIEFA
jgi:hypothetical protein